MPETTTAAPAEAAHRDGGTARAAHDTLTSRCYVDNEGSLWAHINGEWAYLTEYGEFTAWDARAELPEHFAPYIELEEVASSVLLERFAGEGVGR